ncbi:MAG: UvrD-helicase domain-containing protein [bacterium]
MEDIKNIALISAAGSGKTHALTKRFLFLFLSKNNYPLEFLYAITFTNAAAYEMKSRILRYLEVLATGHFEKPQEEDVLNYFKKIYSEKELAKIAECKRGYLLNNLSNLNVSTFHSLFASFLSAIPFEAGIMPDYRIIEETEEEIMFEQAIDKYFEKAYNDKKSAKAISDLIMLEERKIRDIISRLYEDYKPWLSYLSELHRQKEQLSKELDKHSKAVVAAMKQFKGFVEKNIEATYIKNGEINRYWFEFLKKIDQFLTNKDYDTLCPLLSYFMTKEGMQKGYFIDFHNRLENPGQYEEIILQTKKTISSYLEALSNNELIIKFQPLLEIHTIFQKEKRKKNVISFSDIEDLVYAVLSELQDEREVDYLYFKLGSRINHLMIDEFQDTSYKQIDILIPIIDEITAYNPEEKSLFYVGDPHQAIFRWRQGAPELFDKIKQDYEGKISEEKLDMNYRSKIEIINFVNKILNKKDKADSNNSGGWLRLEELGEFPNKDEGNEACMNRVVEIIKELIEKGYKERDIAILIRKNDFGKKLSAILSKNDIPFLSRAQASIMDEPDIHFIINLLRFLDNPEDDFSLFHVLMSNIFNLNEGMIHNIRVDNKTLFLSLTSNHPDWNVTRKLKELLSLVYFMNPYQLIFHICKSLNISISYPIGSLLDAAANYTTEGFGSLTDFIDWIDRYGETIESKETQFEGVRIMTIHKAKGLEFEVVILPETNWINKMDSELIVSYSERAKPEKIFLRNYGKFLPGLLEKEKELCLIDELNLLYVALTRAKSGVWMLGYKRKKGGSGFWFETIKEHLDNSPLPNDDITRKEIQMPQKEKEKGPYKSAGEQISKIGEERELYSPTERGIEIIEPARRRGMRFGDIVHKALNKVNWLDDVEIDGFVDTLSTYVKSNYARTPEEINEVDRRLKPLLREIFNDPDLRFVFYKDKRDVKFKNELQLYFEEGKKDISVHIDRVLIEPDKITIIDYKTGSEKSDYIHQMKMYKRGIEAIYPGMQVSTILIYLDNSSGNRIKLID